MAVFYYFESVVKGFVKRLVKLGIQILFNLSSTTTRWFGNSLAKSNANGTKVLGLLLYKISYIKAILAVKPVIDNLYVL